MTVSSTALGLDGADLPDVALTGANPCSDKLAEINSSLQHRDSPVSYTHLRAHET